MGHSHAREDAKAENASIARPEKRKAVETTSDIEMVGRSTASAAASGSRAEYQTEQALLDALSPEVQEYLSARSSGSSIASSSLLYVNFHGSFTVVMDPNVGHKSRVKRIVAGFSKSTKLPVR